MATVLADRPAASTDAPQRGPWLLSLGFTAAAGVLVVLGWHALAGAHYLGAGLRGAQGQMVGPALVIVVAAVFLAERRWPAVPRPALSRAHVVDAGYLLLFALIGPLITLVDTGFAVTIQQHARFLVLGRLPLGPQAVVVVLILVGMDAMNWVAHVANHRSAPLWRFHALHHSQEDLSVLTTFRTHPMSHASYVPALLPALVLSASGALPAAAVIVYGCMVTLPHANLGWTFGRIGRIVVSPAYHRLHHASEPVGGLAAANFGFVLVCWDRLAHTAVFADGRAPVATGIAGRPVAVEQEGPRSAVARVVGSQLAQPFRLGAGLR